MRKEKRIWQPELIPRSYGFKVWLDNGFAKEMLETPLAYKNQRQLNKLASEDLKVHGIKWPEPYSFHNNSCLINQVYVGNDGCWLSTSHTGLDSILTGRNTKNIEYDSHNVDFSSNAYGLLMLFSKWVELADTLKSLDKD